MILVTEMVGDIRNLMPLGLVTLVAYIIMDLLKGAPVYEAMLEKMLPEEASDEGEVTLIEIPVSDKIVQENKYTNSTCHITYSSPPKFIMARAKPLTVQPECISEI